MLNVKKLYKKVLEALDLCQRRSLRAHTSATPSGTSYTLRANAVYLLITGHNSTLDLNGIWIIRLGGNKAFNLAGGKNITVTCTSNTTVTISTTDGGTVNVYFAELR